jgi:hypothetical protein
MSGMGMGGSYSKSKASSGVQYYGGQENALSGIFAPGGVFARFMSGQPNVGYERQQSIGLDQLKRAQAASGTLNTPLGTRQQSDYLAKTTSQAGDQWLQSLFQFMQPAGQQSKSSSFGVSANMST